VGSLTAGSLRVMPSGPGEQYDFFVSRRGSLGASFGSGAKSFTPKF